MADLAGEFVDEQQRLDLLDSGDACGSVRTVFSWSYRHLPEPAARLFRMLGIHPGPDIDIDATAALADVDVRAARQQLTVLTRAHLVQETAPHRYRMHDLLRAYASDQAHYEDSAEVRWAAFTRLADYHLQAAVQAVDLFAPYEKHRRPRLPDHSYRVPPLANRDVAIAWFDSERANLLAVALHAAANGMRGHTSQLSTALHSYLAVGAHYADAERLHTTAFRSAGADPTVTELSTTASRWGGWAASPKLSTTTGAPSSCPANGGRKGVRTATSVSSTRGKAGIRTRSTNFSRLSTVFR